MVNFYFIFKTVRLYKWSNFQTVLVIQKIATVLHAVKMKQDTIYVTTTKFKNIIFP
jgi:hypothetical protein